MGLEVLKVVSVLIVLLAGMYVLLGFLKKRMLPRKGIIEMVHYQPLGPKKGIAIVKILKDYLLLGIAEENISLLAKMSPAEVEKALGELASEGNALLSPKLRDSGNKIKNLVRGKFFIVLLSALTLFLSPSISFAAQQQGTLFGFSTPLELMLFFTLLSFLPAILVMTTCFTRIIVVLSFLRQALGAPQVPPNQVVVGLALFITLFVMSPVVDRIYTEAYQPYTKKQINAEVALDKAGVPLKEFMLKQTREKDLALFLNMAKLGRPATPMDLPLRVVIPAFAIGELKKAFEIGFLIFLPFLVIDMVVSSVLLSMGMMMLPPVMISMPFKLLLFVLVDGWDLLIGSLVASFR